MHPCCSEARRRQKARKLFKFIISLPTYKQLHVLDYLSFQKACENSQVCCCLLVSLKHDSDTSLSLLDTEGHLLKGLWRKEKQNHKVSTPHNSPCKSLRLRFPPSPPSRSFHGSPPGSELRQDGTRRKPATGPTRRASAQHAETRPERQSSCLTGVAL